MLLASLSLFYLRDGKNMDFYAWSDFSSYLLACPLLFFHLGCSGKIHSSQMWKTQRNKLVMKVTDLHIGLRKLSACSFFLAFAWERRSAPWLPLLFVRGFLMRKLLKRKKIQVNLL